MSVFPLREPHGKRRGRKGRSCPARKLLVGCFLSAQAFIVVGCDPAQIGMAADHGAKAPGAAIATAAAPSEPETSSGPYRHRREIARYVSLGLLVRGAGGRGLGPGLALSYKTNRRSDTYTFTLRRDLRFENGDPFDAHVLKWAIDRSIKRAGVPPWTVYAYVKSVDVIGDYAIRFNLIGPVETFPSLVASPTYLLLNL